MAEAATHAMAEAAAYVVAAGNTHTHAVAESATAEMADTYDAVVETHAVIDDAPRGTDALAEAAAKFMVAAIVQPVGIAEIILACCNAAGTRIICETSGASVGLGGGRLPLEEGLGLTKRKVQPVGDSFLW